ncbi:MAG: MurR/RpiR family transcriptional regulator [Alphaproteobacteria bacterium]|nr:MurR/RpiR family transcriptional regulator [Alphaproteobacteria bacterium]
MDAALVTAKPETLDQLMTQIEQQHANMPKRLREIGNFVLGHPEAIALSTLAELAAETDIATSAFVRFAQTLGFDGFSQMQALFRQQVRSSWPQYASRLSDMADVDPADHFEALSVSAVESINRLSNTVSMEHLETAVRKLTDAETIWFAAGGRAKPVTVYMSYVLTKLGIRSQEFREAPAEAMRELNLVGPRDVLLVVSFAPYGELTVKLAQEAASRGVKIISITDTMVSPAALDTTLLVTEENIFGFRSLCATMNLAQYLAIETGLKRDKDVRNA